MLSAEGKKQKLTKVKTASVVMDGLIGKTTGCVSGGLVAIPCLTYN
jgi:hypothetical protein